MFVTCLLLAMSASQVLAALSSPCYDKYSNCGDFAPPLTYCSWHSVITASCKRSCGTCPTGSSCGNPSFVSSRVIAGKTANQGSWPWQILMIYNRTRPICGGSLVAPNWIVTAAHCVLGKESEASNFIIRAGEHDYTASGNPKRQDIKVKRIIIHSGYNMTTKNNDIAMLEVERPFWVNDRVSMICLPDKTKPVPVGTDCYITGWGKIIHSGSGHPVLQQGKLKVVSQSTCQRLNSANFGIHISSDMLCAGDGGSSQLSGCHGDSGGPFVCQTGAQGRWELHGAVSWGPSDCSSSRGYSVFARVTAFRDWIDATMLS